MGDRLIVTQAPARRGRGCDGSVDVSDHSIGEGTMRKGVLTAVGLAITTMAMVAVPVVSAGASSSTQGVTANAIRVGVPYIDFAPVRALGDDINYEIGRASC